MGAQVRAVGVGLAFALSLLLATPGLDQLDANSFRTEEARARRRAMPFGAWTLAVADANRWFRLPLVRLVEGLQRPLRIAQSWSLYGGGPNAVRRLEVVVDGEIVYRSNDPDRAWAAEVLRYRRVRPMGVAVCRGTRKDGADALLRWLVARARRTWPEAREVTVRCTEAPWDHPAEAREIVRFRARGPDWRARVGPLDAP